MFLPLYKNKHKDTPTKKPDNANTGLWFERFFDQFNHDASDILKPEPKEPNQGKNFWLQDINNAGNTKALQLAAKQQLSLVNALNGQYKFFNTQWHFVTGTGYPHPVENGLLWHKTYGVPYLSGAAVKGLVRAWVEQWQEFETEAQRKECLFSWFGSDDKDPKEQQKTSQAGDIIFFDAFPVQEVKLKTDIMTPHYGDWYSEGGKIKDIAKESEKIPADWHDPVPIPFLVVDSKTPFLFSVALRLRSELIKNKTENEIKEELKKVIACLTEALEWLGAGAKTATGYGQMEFDAKTQKEMDDTLEQEQQALQKAQEWQNFLDSIKNLSPLAQTYFIQVKKQNWENDKNAFWQADRVEEWLDKVEQQPNPQIIGSIKDLMNQHFVGLLANPEKVKGKKAEPVYSKRQQQIALRVNTLL